MGKTVVVNNFHNGKKIKFTDIRDNHLDRFIKYQPESTLFGYKISDSKENRYYIGVKEQKGGQVKEVDNKQFYFLKTKLNSRNDDDRINSILNKVTKYKLIQNSQFNKFKKNLNLLNRQEGGYFINLLEKRVDAYGKGIGQKWLGWFLSGILDFIDILLVRWVLIQPNLMPKVVTLIYSILRFDIYGIVGGVLFFVPIIGSILGAIVKIGGLIAKYLFKVGRYLTRGVVFQKTKSELDELRRLGYKHQQDMVEIVVYGRNLGPNKVDNYLRLVEGIDRDPNLWADIVNQYYAKGKEVATLIINYGQSGIVALTLGAKYGDEAVTNVQRGVKGHVAGLFTRQEMEDIKRLRAAYPQ